MSLQKNRQKMTERELRTYERYLRRKREIRRRLLILAASFCMIVTGAVSYYSIRTSANTGEEDMKFKYYTSITIRNGESLWKIADKYIDYAEYKNKQEYISEVQSINHLENENKLRSGQQLIVPYYSNVFIQ